MNRIKLAAAIISLLVLGPAAARAQVLDGKAAKADSRTKKIEAAFQRLDDSMSKGGTESVAGAGDALFAALGDFGCPAAVDAVAVRSEPRTKSKAHATLVNSQAPDCWEVCVSWGPLHVCYTWEKRCR